MKLVWAADCDCDGFKIIGRNSICEWHKTDQKAVDRFMEIYIETYRKYGTGLRTIQHGPSGHLLQVINHVTYYDIPFFPTKTMWILPLDRRPPVPAVCHGPDDPFCGRCRFSSHGCADPVP